MKLTSLQIHGFKSFADKTVINFNKDITGVVGPNGCGKSNVIDAIRWVLGEQRSKALRSDKMDNLIFNGTKSRKSANRAQVTLTFENNRNLLPTEFSTVTISRALYRTGESEYRINEVACRLKDISTLFMDTGISSDSYAIIELGMISDILSDKDNLRRKLFEQAAGVSKYKKRKRETLNKLNSTEDDLNRVEDLMAEIETNLKSLEKQAKRAERYNKIKAQYKELSIDLAVYKLSAYKGQFDGITGKNSQEQEKRDSIQTRIDDLEASIAHIKENQHEKQERLTTAQLTLGTHMEQLREKETNKGLLGEKTKFLRDKIESLESTINADKEQSEKLQEELELAKEKVQIEEENLNNLVSQLEESKENRGAIKVQFLEKKEKLNQLEEAFKAMEYQYFNLEKDIAIKTNQKETLISDITQSKLQFQSKEDELKDMQVIFDNTQSEADALKVVVEKLQKEKDIISQKRQMYTESIENLREEQMEVNRVLDAKQNEYQLTKSLIDNLEGYSKATKYLKTLEGWEGKDAMLLSEALDCDEDYKLAVEYHLTPILEHYIVSDLDKAQSGIELLRQDKQGKAGFFVLSELEKENFDTPDLAGCIKATSVIKIDKRFQKLADYLLQNVYIAQKDDYDFSAVINDQAVILSKSGNIIRQKGRIGGGSVGSFEGKTIGRLQNLEKLEIELVELEKTSKGLAEEIKGHKEELGHLNKKTVNHDLKIEERKLNEILTKIASFTARIQNYELFLNENSDKVATIYDKVQELETETADLQLQLVDQQTRKEQQSQSMNIFKMAFVKVEGEMQSSSDQYNQLNVEFHQQQNNLNSIKQEIQYKHNTIQELTSKKASNIELLNSTKGEMGNIDSTLGNFDVEIQEMYEEKKRLQEELQDAEQAFFELRGMIDQYDDEIRLLMKNKEQSDQLLSQLKDKKNDLDMQLLSTKERLSIEFGIDLQEILANAPEEPVEMDVEESDLKVAKLKKRLDNYGEVNPFAVEAFDEMQERYNFISSQKADLESAKKILLETINEIETSATEKFMDAFNKVKENFSMVFKRLFTKDDVCNLTLSDPSNPLESKVDIIAKPKGKRPLTINQLSGGEKSLTAISLIFGLYLLKPAPFCILDEVDAPLDDANLVKFNDIIRTFAENSQFIIVTHRKPTMAKVQAIYGVTMAETGISRLVPADFSSLN